MVDRLRHTIALLNDLARVHIDRVGDATQVLKAAIGKGPVGRLAIHELAE